MHQIPQHGRAQGKHLLTQLCSTSPLGASLWLPGLRAITGRNTREKSCWEEASLRNTLPFRATSNWGSHLGSVPQHSSIAAMSLPESYPVLYYWHPDLSSDLPPLTGFAHWGVPSPSPDPDLSAWPQTCPITTDLTDNGDSQLNLAALPRAGPGPLMVRTLPSWLCYHAELPASSP